MKVLPSLKNMFDNIHLSIRVLRPEATSGVLWSSSPRAFPGRSDLVSSTVYKCACKSGEKERTKMSSKNLLWFYGSTKRETFFML